MALDYAKSLGIFEKKKDKSRSTRYTRRVDRAPRCTTLIDAAYWGKYDECRSLVQSGVDPDIKTEYGGWTAVMLAAEIFLDIFGVQYHHDQVARSLVTFPSQKSSLTAR